MDQTVFSLIDYFLKVIYTTLNQLFILLGPLMFLALIMNIVSRINESLSYKILGRRVYLYFFGWLGTVIHEIGHALFAFIFGHKIYEIKLFTPASEESLGHVSHGFDTGNPYQRIGNFFIGIGPILLGTGILFLITYFLFNFNVFEISQSKVFNYDFFLNLDSFKSTLIAIGNGILEYSLFIFDGPKSQWWRILIFVYLLYQV